MRKAELRLDRREFAISSHEKSGPAIIPSAPDRSPLIARVESKDEKQRMPPPETHKFLTPGETALLRRWISEGAEYQEHWSFISPSRPVVPAVKLSNWTKNDIDCFVLARLEAEGLHPSSEADRRTIIRRVHYDLTGLPPTPGEVEAFLRDTSPNAYEKIVDQLLSRLSYGEHRARYWLDAARYGDSHGLHTDQYRSVWPYRDYVIKSYNTNKPFDQFTREQLAGDLFPADQVDQIVATAFIRLGIANSEAGTIEEEQRNILLTERTKTFSAVFLGMTTGCAACHDHKFDPTTQKDFYQLGAFFNNLDEFHNTRAKEDWPPNIKVPKPEDRATYNAILARRAEIQREFAARRLQASTLIRDWLMRGENRPQPVSSAGLLVRLRLDEGHGVTLFNSAPGAAFSSVTVKGGAPEWGEDTWFWPSFRMADNSRIQLPPDIGDAVAEQPFTVGTWLMPRGDNGAESRPPVGTILARVETTQGSRGWGIYYDSVPDPSEKAPAKPKKLSSLGKLSFRLVSSWPDNAIVVETTGSVLARGVAWKHVLATYDGSRKAKGVRLYVDGRLQEVSVIKDNLTGDTRTTAPLQFGAEHPDANRFHETRFQDVRLYARELQPDEAARVAFEDFVAEIVARDPARWTEDEFNAVSNFYFSSRDATAQVLSAQLETAEAELKRLSESGVVCLVAKERPRLAYANVLERGVFSRRGERVHPGVPQFLPALPPDAPRDRRGLAEWVVGANNPLTARVTVNRMWQELFGAGLVETTTDFGLVGARPLHRALLDWLAVDFREHGWDVKRFYKQLVMSAIYRQSANVTPELLARDPNNRLLARGPRFRMDAEMVRDTALAVSGLLFEKIGGPSVKPYQPEGVWEALTYPENGAYKPEKYVLDRGDGLYRRSIYTYTKRQALIPNMEILDQPVRDESCTRRQRANTPLQALVLMNDPQWLEAARCLAERVILHSPSLPGRLDYLGELLLGRPWMAKEKEVLASAFKKFQATYAHDPTAAIQLIGHGESRPTADVPATELAPWMLVASTALNLDATMNK